MRHSRYFLGLVTTLPRIRLAAEFADVEGDGKADAEYVNNDADKHHFWRGGEFRGV